MASLPSLPVRERGSKRLKAITLAATAGRSPCGSVDRNQPSAMDAREAARRSPCGSVDRNSITAVT